MARSRGLGDVYKRQDNNYYQPLWTDMAATPPDRLTQLGVSHADSESLSPYG
jgi:hypothetical protein